MPNSGNNYCDCLNFSIWKQVLCVSFPSFIKHTLIHMYTLSSLWGNDSSVTHNMILIHISLVHYLNLSSTLYTAPARIASFSQTLRRADKSNVILPCISVGRPIPTITWRRATEIIRGESGSSHELSQKGTLSIHRECTFCKIVSECTV